MLTILIVCLCLGTNVHAASIAPSISNSTLVDNVTTSSSAYNIEEELNKIATTCVTDRDYKQLSGNKFEIFYSQLFYRQLIKEAEKAIGLTEMRAALGFSPPGPWKEFRWEPIDATQLAAASTVEEYFDLKEPISKDQTTDSTFFFEHNFPPIIAFLDERMPSIRNIFKHEFRELLRKNLGGAIDRKTVDHIIDEYSNNILPRVANATDISLYYSYKRCRTLEEMQQEGK